jgi:hypothetical protein
MTMLSVAGRAINIRLAGRSQGNERGFLPCSVFLPAARQHQLFLKMNDQIGIEGKSSWERRGGGGWMALY